MRRLLIQLLSLSKITFLESIRHRALMGLLMVALGFMGFSVVLSALALRDQALRVVTNFGVFSLSFLGVVIAIILGVILVYKEIQRKTIYTVLSKPVPRPLFVMGKYMGLVAMLAVTNLVEIESESLRDISGFINIGLLAVIWWSAHKLTWDCTWINEDEDAGGEGLLGNLGLDESEFGKDVQDTSNQLKRQLQTSDTQLSWWQRFTQRRQRPHAPGLWIIYFSLAALPLFGFGQWFSLLVGRYLRTTVS